MKACKVTGCTDFQTGKSARGYFGAHYKKWLKYGDPKVVKLGRPLITRFLEKLKKGPDCWVWTGRTNKNGYGIFTIGHSKKVLAHRQAWEFEYGPIPEGMKVLHKCDNPPCCNTNHHFLGTQADNVKDAKSKGRCRNKYSGFPPAVTCGHPDRPHQGYGKCRSCFMKDYHRKRNAACHA